LANPGERVVQRPLAGLETSATESSAEELEGHHRFGIARPPGQDLHLGSESVVLMYAAFAEAEAMQAEWQPQFALLYSLLGFRYCDLLLAAAERAAWSGPCAEPQAGGGDGSSGDNGAEERDGAGAGDGAGLVAVCAEVAPRGSTIFEWRKSPMWNHAWDSQLDIGLDHLITLARCALYSDRLQGGAPGPEARDRAERAHERLRVPGPDDEFPRGLLTRARIRHARGDPARGDADLREAERIDQAGKSSAESIRQRRRPGALAVSAARSYTATQKATHRHVDLTPPWP
jgi:hypothetical protein